MIRLIGIDLDGTLLDKKGELPEENILAARFAWEKGALPVICTGRMYATALKFRDALGVVTPMVVCNGGEIRKSDLQVLRRDVLHMSDVELGLETAAKYGLCPIMSDGERMFLEAPLRHRAMEVYGEAFDEFEHFEYPDDKSAMLRIAEKNGAVKIVFATTDADALFGARIFLLSREQTRYAVTSSWTRSMDMIGAESSKGAALLRIAESMGIGREEIMAIGDHENDLSMFEIAGVSVAMGNADQLVKDKATFVTMKNDELGFVAAIRKVFCD